MKAKWYMRYEIRFDHFPVPLAATRAMLKIILLVLFCSDFLHEDETAIGLKSENTDTAWKVSKYGVSSGLYCPVLGLNTDQRKLRIWTLFTQWDFWEKLLLIQV